MQRWAEIYLHDARERLEKDLKGFGLTVEEVYMMQQMCAYEVRPFPFLPLSACVEMNSG